MKSCWNLKSGRFYFLVLFFIGGYPVTAQLSKSDSAEPVAAHEEKYIFPIKPGSPGSLAGTMGELRSTHFHSGIDIRTNNEIGWPVLAAKSGYISRAGVSPSGYGNVLYVKHPDGNTTVYGHLDKFNGALGDYIRQQRYARKTSSINLEFKPTQFPVKQGDTIAFAGNTGSSGGPHLHFNIQRNEFALDPLSFQFAEIRDVTPPVAQKIALKTLDIDSRVNDRFGRFEFYLSRSGKDYTLTAPVLAYGNIGIELLGYDRVDNARFRCGINYIEVFADDRKIFSQKIEEVNLLESRSIYGFFDYKTHREQGDRFYKLYRDDSNKLNFYASSPGNGRVQIDTTKTTNILIVLKDAYGNISNVSVKLKPSKPVQKVTMLEAATLPAVYDIQENTLSVVAQPCNSASAIVYSNGIPKTITPDYYNTGKSVYLIDLRKAIPDSITVCDQILIPNLRATISSEIEYKYYSDQMDIIFPKGALFDTLYFNSNYALKPDSSEVFTIGSSLVPLKQAINISLKPQLIYAADKTVGIYRVAGKGYSYEGGRWSNGTFNFSTREFGDFTILKDTVPPTIQVIYVNNQAARFRIKDNLSGINAFEATINGQWLLMNYDAKSNIIMSEKLNAKQPLKGELILTVTDNAGNQKVYKHRIP